MNLDSRPVEASLLAGLAGLDGKDAQRKGAKDAEELPPKPLRLCVQFFAFSCREIASKLAPKSNVFLEMNP